MTTYPNVFDPDRLGTSKTTSSSSVPPGSGFVEKSPNVQSTQSAYPNTPMPGQPAQGGHYGYGSKPKGGTTVGTKTTYPGQPTGGYQHPYPNINPQNSPNQNRDILEDLENLEKENTIKIHNDNKGNTAAGNSIHPNEYDYKFKSIVTKNNTYLNTEDDIVMSTWEAVEKLKRQNPGWTELEAANYLNYGTTNRKGGKSKTANRKSEKLLQETGLMNTWGMGIRGDYNFGKAMDVQSYSNGLDWAAANTGELSPEDQKIQRAILDSTKQFKKPSKFADFFKDMPSAIGIINKLKNIQPTRETFDTPVGSVGWDNLAIRQLKRGELMPDGSNPYNYLNKHENEEFGTLAKKYTPGVFGLHIEDGKYVWGKALSDYKPMKWFKERDLPQDEVDRRNAQLFEEDLVGIEDDNYITASGELFRTIKTEMENSNIDDVNNIRIDGDIVSLNEAFQEGPDLMSNENEIANSSISHSVYQPSVEDTSTEEADEKTTEVKYIHPGDRSGGFEALFGMPSSPYEITDEPQDTKDYRAASLANSGVTWDEYLGKYVYYDAALGQTAYYTPEEFRLEYNL